MEAPALVVPVDDVVALIGPFFKPSPLICTLGQPCVLFIEGYELSSRESVVGAPNRDDNAAIVLTGGECGESTAETLYGTFPEPDL